MPDALDIDENISIPLQEISMQAVRSRGAGGQNVNKVASAIHLRFDVRASSLPEPVRERLLALDDRRVTADGVIIIKAQESRSQEANRRAALERLRALIRENLSLPEPRQSTRVPAAEKRRRVADKRHRGAVKRGRQSHIDDD